jgi:hypothetical protein
MDRFVVSLVHISIILRTRPGHHVCGPYSSEPASNLKHIHPTYYNTALSNQLPVPGCYQTTDGFFGDSWVHLIPFHV